MKELALKYGCNPNQKPARIFMEEGELPVKRAESGPGPARRHLVQAREPRGRGGRRGTG